VFLLREQRKSHERKSSERTAFKFGLRSNGPKSDNILK
jgi:hypothetical protein